MTERRRREETHRVYPGLAGLGAGEAWAPRPRGHRGIHARGDEAPGLRGANPVVGVRTARRGRTTPAGDGDHREAPEGGPELSRAFGRRGCGTLVEER